MRRGRGQRPGGLACTLRPEAGGGLATAAAAPPGTQPALLAPHPPRSAADACKEGAENVEDITHLGSWLKYVERQAARQAGQQ